MKFKSIFLGMLGMAAIVSCNNDNVVSPDSENPNINEGKEVYATFALKFSNATLQTYAGGSDILATAAENKVTDAGMYVYRFDGVSTFPEKAVYLSSVPTTNVITMKATAGRKKIFMAINPAQAANSLVPISGLGDVSKDLTTSYVALNNSLYPTAAGFVIGTEASETEKADGLIKTFAKGEIKGNGGGTYTGTYDMLMTNWDGADDTDSDGSGTATTFSNTCEFNLVADIDSTVSSNAASGGSAEDLTKNALFINVQRAYSKVALRITAPAGTHALSGGLTAGFTTNSFVGAPSADQEGEFHPWGTATSGQWTVGNITKGELPFQQQVGGHVRDLFYQNTNDSITNFFSGWRKHYDNTRVFPTSMTSYPMPGLSVSQVKTVMNTANNFTILTAPTAAEGAYEYVYVTENAREHPVKHDHATYICIGGRYAPKKVLTTIARASVPSNPPVLTYTDNYGWNPSAGDTLYYVSSDKIFIAGLNNLQGYYAWQKKFEQGAPADFSVFTSATTDAINAARTSDLYAYFEGQCWYRVFIQDDKQPQQADQVITRRNHVYLVDITNIKGPGIADPNKILIPGQNVLSLDTYVTATIKVLNWHKVQQSAEVDNN